MKFKVGDKVYLSKNSKFNNGKSSNPIDVMGNVYEITKDYAPDSWIRVKWSNGGINGYHEECLILATPNNVLSRAMYPKLSPTKCGKYLEEV